MRAGKRIAAIAAATVLLVVAAPGEAVAAGQWSRVKSVHADGKTFQIQWVMNDCGTDSLMLQPGSQAWMREVGSTGVNRFKVQYQWQEKNTFDKWTTTLRSSTFTAPVADDGQSYKWKAPAHRFGKSSGGFYGSGRLLIKYTFERYGKRDYNFKQVAAYCSAGI
jgi:hypothetical protein